MPCSSYLRHSKGRNRVVFKAQSFSITHTASNYNTQRHVTVSDQVLQLQNAHK